MAPHLMGTNQGARLHGPLPPGLAYSSTPDPRSGLNQVLISLSLKGLIVLTITKKIKIE